MVTYIKTRNRRRAVIAGLAASLLYGAAPATAQEGDDPPPAQDPWSRVVKVDADAQQLGLQPGAPDGALARAAIERSSAQLGLNGRAGVRAASEIEPGGDGAGALVRFEQTLGGLRVLWGDLSVSVRDGRVDSIQGTNVDIRGKLTGKRRIAQSRAVAIARRDVKGADSALRAQLVAYAGSPSRPRSPRRAFVVQVTPKSQPGHLQHSICVVVDAETGRVLGRWRGTAADQPTRRPAVAKAQVPGTTLYQLTNFGRQPGENNYAFGKLRLAVFTTKNPYLYGEDGGLNAKFFDVFDQNLSYLAPWVTDITRYFCRVRNYCGRDSGTVGVGGGDYSRWFVVGNHFSATTEYDPADKHIFIGRSDSDDPDVVAHEVGHAIDDHFEGSDYLDTFEGSEVREALADMFSYDWDRDGLLTDGKTPPTSSGSNPDDGGVSTDFGNPAAAGEAGHYSGYSCTTGDEHDNGSILAHAYHRLVVKLGPNGHQTAGLMLQYIPMALPARREFGDVRESFEATARGLFPNGGKYEGSVEQKVDQAFNEVGVKDASRRVDRCPGANP